MKRKSLCPVYGWGSPFNLIKKIRMIVDLTGLWIFAKDSTWWDGFDLL